MSQIAVVEDNPSNMKLIRDVLTLAGHQVVEYMDADTGVAGIVENSPNLIIMDLHLPGTNGLEATRLLKNNSRTAHIPLIIMTARALDDDKELIHNSGCDAYMFKPIQYKEVLTMVKKLL